MTATFRRTERRSEPRHRPGASACRIDDAFGFLKLPEHCSLHTYWQLGRRLRRHGFAVEYYEVPVLNDYFRNKVREFAGSAGLVALRILNPDRLPMPLRTNFYVNATMLAG